MEDVLRELVDSVADAPGHQGPAHPLVAIHYFAQGQYQSALDECTKARDTLPDGGPFVRFVEGHALSYLRRHDEAFSAYQASHDGLSPLFDLLSLSSYVAPTINQWKADFYQRWALVGLMQGLEGSLGPNVMDLKMGGEKVVSVLRAAQTDGQEDAIWSVMADLEKSSEPELQSHIQEFQQFVRLMLIEDPFEGLRALAKSISAAWPEGVDCVEAIREDRR